MRTASQQDTEGEDSFRGGAAPQARSVPEGALPARGWDGLRVRAAGRGAHLGVSESGQCDVVPDSARAWGTGVTRLTQESSVVTIWDGARNYRSITLEESHKLFNPATVSVL